MTTRSIGKRPRNMHPNSLANLKPPFEPGNRANQNGGPPGPYLTNALKRILAMTPEKRERFMALPDSRLNGAELQARTTLRNALAVETGRRGTASSEAIVWERSDGRVAQPVEHTGEGGGPILVREIVHHLAMGGLPSAAPGKPLTGTGEGEG